MYIKSVRHGCLFCFIIVTISVLLKKVTRFINQILLFVFMLLLIALLSVLLVSLVSFIGAFSLFFQKKQLQNVLLCLVSLSAGTLFGDVFFHLLPESVSSQGFNILLSFLVLSGIVVFFVLEKIIHGQHSCAHSLLHTKTLHHIGAINLMGDGLHNFTDGLIIAGSYLVSVPVGVATTLAVILHEVPQELADFGVLLYAGYSRRQAFFLNFVSALVAVVGTVVGLLLGTHTEFFVSFILPFAAGGFLYIAGSNLVPELHKQCDLRSSICHVLFLLIGIGLMFLLASFG